LTGSAVTNGDRRDFELVNQFAQHTGWLHGPMTGYARYGVGVFAVLLLVGWWVARRSGEASRVAGALWVGAGAVVAVGLNQPLVGFVHEARPYQAIPHVLLLVHASSDPSFPSDHATMAGAVTAGLFLVSRRLATVALAAAVLMAFARVYVGAHYPVDVAAGLVVGALVVLAGWLMARPALLVLVDRMRRSPVRPLVSRGAGEART
jgi:undecaprenyl-diphosphatase